MNSNPLLLIRPIIPALSLPLSGEPPASRAVLRELHKILREDPFFRTQNLFFSLDYEWLNAFINFLVFIFHYPLLILLGIAVILGLYFLIRGLAPYFRGKSFSDGSPTQFTSRNKALPPNHFLTLYRQALDQSRARQYKQALISLHKATVEYLLTRVIITGPQKKYTNNDLKRKLGANLRLQQSFSVIAGYAEIAGFSAFEISEADFNQALEAFEKSFLEKTI